MPINPDLLQTELTFRTSRSGGKGGQNVNKVETRVEAVWNLAATALLTPEEQVRVQSKLKRRMSNDGVLSVACSTTRSQLKNRQLAIERLVALVDKALVVLPPRKATKVPKAVKAQRLTAKRERADLKLTRKRPNNDHS